MTFEFAAKSGKIVYCYEYIVNCFDNLILKYLSSEYVMRFSFISNSFEYLFHIGQVGMTSLQVNCSLTEVNASVFIAVF